MKGIQFNIIIYLALFLAALAIVILIVVNNVGPNLWGLAWGEKALQANVENHENELQKLYNDYKDNDGGFDAYETSILLAKAIEFTWSDCYQRCKDERELFTGFFAKNPIDFNRDMDCTKLTRIKGKCSAADLGTDKTQKVDEWTVTAWGLLANSEMCSNYRLSNEDNKQWGNDNCGAHDVAAPGKKCADFCGRSPGMDKVGWDAGIMTKGNKYSTIRIAYDPEGPKIMVREIS